MWFKKHQYGSYHTPTEPDEAIDSHSSYFNDISMYRMGILSTQITCEVHFVHAVLLGWKFNYIFQKLNFLE
jgi:hypothetical protein